MLFISAGGEARERAAAPMTAVLIFDSTLNGRVAYEAETWTLVSMPMPKSRTTRMLMMVYVLSMLLTPLLFWVLPLMPV